MPELSSEEIRKELAAIRAEISQLGSVPTFSKLSAKDHSKWSAHGDWSSGSKSLDGRFSLSSELGSPSGTERLTEQLEKVLADVTSAKFLEVAKSLKSTLTEKVK